MAKKFNTRLIKTRESYTTKDISKLLNVHPKTVQLWVKEGLPSITEKPIFVKGFKLKAFLDNKQQKRKCKLEADEFYCIKCRKAVRPNDKVVWLELTGKTLGRNNLREIVIKGVCDECLTRINRFAHEGLLEQITNSFEVINMEEITHGK